MLLRNTGRRNNQLVVKIGDKEVNVSTEFRLYLTTKLPNPNYTPEISTKAMIVNFAVKMSGLEAQLLNTVVKHERPDLAKQKSDLVVKVGVEAAQVVCCCPGQLSCACAASPRPRGSVCCVLLAEVCARLLPVLHTPAGGCWQEDAAAA